MTTRPTPTPDMTTAEHIARAKAELGAGDHESALVHALIAIAEQGQPIDTAITEEPPGHVSNPTVFIPDDEELRLARSEISSTLWLIERGLQQPTYDVINDIISRAVVAMHWMPRPR